MSFVAALWCVLLQALASAAALPCHVGQGVSVGVSARIEWASASPADLSTTLPRVPAESVRATHLDVPAAFARLGWRLPLGDAPVLSVRNESARLGLARTTQRVLRSMGTETHRLPSRGSLLPYDPTAPPGLA